MFRLLVLVAALAAAMPCENSLAQGRGRFWNRGGHHTHSNQSYSHQNRYRGLGGYRMGSPATLFGFSFGTVPYGYDYAGYPDPYFTYPYSYDPWLRGSFRAPDLLDDPYFYDRVPSNHRYPAPRPTRPFASRPIQPSTIQPLSVYRPSVEIDPYSGGPSVLVQPGTSRQGYDSQGYDDPRYDSLPVESLSSACDRLLQNLAGYGGGDAWIEYLAPDRISELAEQGNRSELRQLMARFDGVAQNHQLGVVASIDGFAETRALLRKHLDDAVSPTAPISDRPRFETLPAPKPEPILESPANNPLEI